MKLNARHKVGLKIAKALPAPWRWKLLKIPSPRVLAADYGKVIASLKEDLSPIIPSRHGPHGELIGSDVFTFSNAYSTHWGAHLTSEGQLISDLSRQGFGVDKDHFAFGKPRIKTSRHVHGTVAALTIEHRSNYFHFLSDAIARLQLIQNLQYAPDFIYIQSNHPYQAEILCRLGYKPEQIIDSSQNPFISADHLLVPSFTSNFSIINSNSISYFRSTLGKNISQSSSSQGSILYISRRDTPRRKVLNEEALLKKLSGFHVESAALSELSVARQIELFSNAKVVIIPTGAGLANLAFAPPDAFVILLTPPGWFGEAAGEIIASFGLKFHQIMLSDYPAEADSYQQPVRLTVDEIDTVSRLVLEAKNPAHLYGDSKNLSVR